MKRIIFLVIAILNMFMLVACKESSDVVTKANQSNTTKHQDKETEDSSSSKDSKTKTLVVYFSATGNTKNIAEKIAELTGAELFEIIPTESYSSEDLNYSNDECRANKEQNDSGIRPQISNRIDNIESYDVILVGYPIWWGEEPRIIDTFIEEYDFTGKTVANFCTSGASEINESSKNIKNILGSDVNWLEGHRFEEDAEVDDVKGWVNELWQ